MVRLHAARALLLLVCAAGRSFGGPPALVANHESDDLTVIDSATHVAGDPLGVGSSPSAVLFSPLGRFTFVANAGSRDDPQADSVTVFDARTLQPLADVEVGDAPAALAAAPDGRLVFVVNSGRDGVSDGTVSIVDTRVAWGDLPGDAVVATVETGGDPGGAATSPDGRFVYVTNRVLFERNVVFVIDVEQALVDPGAGVVDEIVVGNTPLGIAVTADGRRAYVANFAFGSNRVSIVDLEGRVALGTVRVGSRPSGVALSPDGAFVYVTNFISDTVSVIDTSSDRVRATIDVGAAPYGVAFAPRGGFAYVANRQSLDTPTAGTVSVIDTSLALPVPGEAVITTVDTGLNPIAVAIAADPIEAFLARFFAPEKAADADVNRDLEVTAADLLALIDEQFSG